MAISLTFLLSADPTSRIYSKRYTPNFNRNNSGLWKNWPWAYKTGNISETVKGRAKVTIDGLHKVIRGLSIAAQMYDLE